MEINLKLRNSLGLVHMGKPIIKWDWFAQLKEKIKIIMLPTNIT